MENIAVKVPNKKDEKVNQLDTLTAQAVENPEILATMSEMDTRHVMARLLQVGQIAYRAWLAKSDNEQLVKRLLRERRRSRQVRPKKEMRR
jgi:hypothetical protein